MSRSDRGSDGASRPRVRRLERTEAARIKYCSYRKKPTDGRCPIEP